MAEKKLDQHFMSIIMMFATACWQHLGKVPNQMTNKTEQDLPNAQFMIDLLRMLVDKTKGNLSPDEEKLLLNTVSDLELNYADEVNKASQAPKADKPAEPKPEETKQ